MQWSLRLQLLYALGIVLVLGSLAVAGWYFFFYTPPSCADRVQNQNEEGIDCGGVCTLLCEAPKISALWARAVKVAPGVYHAVAMVWNPESGARTIDLPFTFSIFDSENILIAERRGVMVLEPGETVPLFEANIISGERVPAHTFVTLGEGVWHRMDRAENPIRITSQSLDQKALRLSASVENRDTKIVENIILTALLYGGNDVLIAASQTVIPVLPARGLEEIVFTWQEPFSEVVVRSDIVSRIRE